MYSKIAIGELTMRITKRNVGCEVITYVPSMYQPILDMQPHQEKKIVCFTFTFCVRLVFHHQKTANVGKILQNVR